MTAQTKSPTRRQYASAGAWLCLLLCLGLTACSTPFSMYRDTPTIQETTALKEEALALMTKGTEKYSKHKTAAVNLLNKANAQYEKQKKREKNDLTVKQWKLLLEDDSTTGTSGILTGFFKEWESTETPLTKFFINEKKQKVGEAFDEILKLEQAKPVKN